MLRTKEQYHKSLFSMKKIFTLVENNWVEMIIVYVQD